MTVVWPFGQAARQAHVLQETAHRPWPVPRRHWLLAQTWEDLLFAHWRVDADRMQDHVPGIPVDTWDGSAWLGVTPFVLSGLRSAGTVPVPGISTFPELNVRTYVTVDGKPGIYFLSLDAASSLAVIAARRLYQLPYFRARMRAERDGAWVRYSSRRTDDRGPLADFDARYRGAGAERTAAPGTLEHFLAERYCLYTIGRSGGVFRAEIHHPPWPLQDAEATVETNTMPPPTLAVSGEPICHYARRQDVVVWQLERA